MFLPMNPVARRSIRLNLFYNPSNFSRLDDVI